MITLQQILAPETETSVLETLLDLLSSVGFSARSWQDGSRQLNLVTSFARMYSYVTTLAPRTAEGGFNQYAQGLWLYLLSDSHYDNQVILPVATQGTVALIASSQAAGPQSKAAGEIVIADNQFGFTYRNRFAFTLTPGTIYPMEVEAEVAGSNRDVAPNTITIMKTPIAGVSVINPPIAATGTWITRNGADIESDDALRIRNRSKWGTLGVGPGLAYQHWARMGHQSVRRVYVDDRNPRGPGTVDVYVAGDSGALASAVVDAVDDYLHGDTDGIDRVATCSDLVTLSAVDDIVNVTANVYVLAQFNNQATYTAISDAITAYFKQLPIGGTKTADTGLGVVAIGSLFLAIMKIQGVQNVSFSSPVGDRQLALNAVAVPSVQLTYLPV